MFPSKLQLTFVFEKNESNLNISKIFKSKIFVTNKAPNRSNVVFSRKNTFFEKDIFEFECPSRFVLRDRR